MTTITYFAVKHLPSGGYLPEVKGWHGRGGSFAVPTDPRSARPRLFHSPHAAKSYLGSWLKGEYHTSRGQDSFSGEYYEDTSIVPKPDRRREDMEVVPINVEMP